MIFPTKCSRRIFQSRYIVFETLPMNIENRTCVPAENFPHFTICFPLKTANLQMGKIYLATQI